MKKTLNSNFLSGKLGLFICFGLSLLLLSSCMKDDTPAQPEFRAALNVVNASPGPMSFKFSLNRKAVNGDALSYTKETWYFLTLHGIQDFELFGAGSSEGDYDTEITLKEETYHTLFITGENSSLTSLFTEDDLSNPPPGKAKIRFVHLTPDGGDFILTIKDGATLFQARAFKTASDFIAVDPGEYTLELKTATGTVLSESDVTVTEKKIYTAWSKGLVSGTGGTPVGLEFVQNN